MPEPKTSSSLRKSSTFKIAAVQHKLESCPESGKTISINLYASLTDQSPSIAIWNASHGNDKAIDPAIRLTLGMSNTNFGSYTVMSAHYFESNSTEQLAEYIAGVSTGGRSCAAFSLNQRFIITLANGVTYAGKIRTKFDPSKLVWTIFKTRLTLM